MLRSAFVAIGLAVGVSAVLAQANPIPTMEKIICWGLFRNNMEDRPNPPMTSAMEWVIFLLVSFASQGSTTSPNAAAKRLYQPNIPLTRLAPSLYAAVVVSEVPYI